MSGRERDTGTKIKVETGKEIEKCERGTEVVVGNDIKTGNETETEIENKPQKPRGICKVHVHI